MCREDQRGSGGTGREAPPKLALVEDGDWAARALGATGDILRAALLALGPHAEHIGFGDIFTQIVAFRDAQQIKFQANVHAPLDGAFAAAHAMLQFYVRTVGVRATVAMGVPSWRAWSGCIERWAKQLGELSAVLYDVIGTPIGPIKVEWTAAVLGEQGVVAAARTGHAVLLHDPHEKMRFHGAVDLVALLAGTPIPKEQLEALELASSTFTGLRRSRFLDIEALGRKQLRLIGVPEDEMKDCTPEDAMAWAGMVAGFEHGAKGGAKGRGVTHVMDEETAAKRGRFWWSPALIESFDAAIHELGGVKAATPSAILQKMPAAKSMSALTRTVVAWRLMHARRMARR